MTNRQIILYLLGLVLVVYLFVFVKGFNLGLNNFSDLTIKKCEFSKNLGNYTLEYIKTEKPIWDSARKNKQSHMTSVQYGVNSDAWSVITVGTFASKENADRDWQENVTDDFKDCEIENIKGVCRKKISKNESNIDFNFYWKEHNTIRGIAVMTTTKEGGLAKTTAEKEKVAEEGMKLFLSVARDCRIDTKEDYIAPHVKRMSL